MDLDILGVENIRAVICGDVRERVRDSAEITWRVPGEPGAADDYRVLTGYPAVFDQWTVLYEGKHFVMREQVAPGFFDDVLKDDCHLNYVHDSASAMARNGLSGIGGMELSTDAHGLRVFAQLPLDDPDVQRIAPKMDRGVVNQMSFAFTVSDEELLQYEDDQGRTVYDYTLKKCKRLYDVCVCPLGAYAQTESMLRSMFAGQLAGRSLEGLAGAEGRSDEGAPAGESRSPEGSRIVLLAECEAAKLRYRPRKEADHDE